ncbi:unnamed protein product [Mytilus coruscus]|uniref:Uncharacterized protein n=1 Tax=Mytilus coruscus TaxID=42192 RepID=A0A6J8EAW1_MYTCO|nr:unnamed protein product [Mytilus coruscus]
MDSALHFKKLRSLTKTKLQTEHHLSNLKKYIQSRTVPKGLNIKMSPQAPGQKSKRFMSRWNEILLNCSIQLLRLLLSFTTTNYKQIVNEISDIINSGHISRDDLPRIKRRLEDIEKIEQSKHREKQRNEFQRDKVHTVSLNQHINDINTTNHKAARRRKFKRQKQKTESIVVNLSSKELTRAEESLLSKGLNVCPTPSNVNSFQLDEDLDQFARR